MNIKEVVTNNKRTFFFVIIGVFFFCFCLLYIQRQDKQLKDLKIAFAENQGQLEVLQRFSQEQLAQIEEQKKTITGLQKERDKAVKEAVKNAYIQGSSIADSDVLNAWNETISRARKRNTERKNNLTNN